MTSAYPRVLIVGRMNVGKSTLFNRLVGGHRSMVFDREGVTRDFIVERVSWKDVTFDLVDTGGVPPQDTRDEIMAKVRAGVLDQLAHASLIMQVIDGSVGVTHEDRAIAKLVHQSKNPAFLVVNKCDRGSSAQHAGEEYSLGIQPIFTLSATHGSGTADVLAYIADTLPARTPVSESAACSVVLLGKPNVGKSSLLNALLERERSIVSDIAGTTREAVREQLMLHKEPIELVDTAGVRRQKKVDDDLEELMVKSSLQAVRDATIVLLLIDASAQQLSDQELKLLFYAHEQNKAVILIFNKSDLIDQEVRKHIEDQCSRYDYILDTMPQIWISCLQGKNIGRVLTEVHELRQRLAQKFPQEKLEAAIKIAMTERPIYANGTLLRVKRCRQLEARTPTFLLLVNNADLFNDSHRKYVENILRRNFDLKGCPVRLFFRTVRI